MPKSAATLEFASAEQGSIRGDYAIAWRFEGLQKDEIELQLDSGVVSIRIRLLVPPSGQGVLRFPVAQSSDTKVTFRRASSIPDLNYAKTEARNECDSRRRRRLGFAYNWDYDRNKEEWFKRLNGKAIGTPCNSFLFHPSLENTQWAGERAMTKSLKDRLDESLSPGFYEVVVNNWPLEKEVEGRGRLGNIPEYFKGKRNPGPFCTDESEYDWNIIDATHII